VRVDPDLHDVWGVAASVVDLSSCVGRLGSCAGASEWFVVHSVGVARAMPLQQTLEWRLSASVEGSDGGASDGDDGGAVSSVAGTGTSLW